MTTIGQDIAAYVIIFLIAAVLILAFIGGAVIWKGHQVRQAKAEATVIEQVVDEELEQVLQEIRASTKDLQQRINRLQKSMNQGQCDFHSMSLHPQIVLTDSLV